jgi:hypothetical protein
LKKPSRATRTIALLAVILGLVLTLCLSAVAMAEVMDPTAEGLVYANSAYVVDGSMVIDRRAQADIKARVFPSFHLLASSAIYAKNGAHAVFLKPIIFGDGYLTTAELYPPNEWASKYGLASAVLVNGEGTEVTLVLPMIRSLSTSTANGAFASCGGSLILKGGSIETSNEMGHGLDATWGSHIVAYGTRIHTSGLRSSAVATDFGGGFITLYNADVTSDMPTSAGIYTAGMSVITAYNSRITAKGAEGVMIAHDSGQTNLYNCILTGPYAINGHNSMTPLYSYLLMEGGTINSTSGALITEAGGKSDVTLRKVKIGTIGDGNLINPQSGRLIVRMEDMKPTGTITRAAKSYLEVILTKVNLNAAVTATKLTVDARSKWKVAGESSIVNISLASRKVVSAAQSVTVYYNTLNIGGTNITGNYDVGNVHFVYSATLVDDYEEAGPPPPPPGP